MAANKRFLQYIYLMRLHRPIGILLLLWPTLWALWLSSNNHPDHKILVIFIAGVILMRSAGCIFNDYADRDLDQHVKRTQDRPLAANRIPASHALILAGVLVIIAFILVLNCNLLTIKLAFIGLFITLLYPFLKRLTHLPQLGLGIAFAWGVPMAFAAQTGMIGISGWFLFINSVIWSVIYDTMYAMIDREDDIRVGIKSAAILFAQMDRMIIALLQLLFVIMLIIIGLMFQMHVNYYAALGIVFLLFVYQQWLISLRDAKACYQAFTNNNWVGLVIFLGILTSYTYPIHTDAILRLGLLNENNFHYAIAMVSAEPLLSEAGK